MKTLPKICTLAALTIDLLVLREQKLVAAGTGARGPVCLEHVPRREIGDVARPDGNIVVGEQPAHVRPRSLR